MWTRQREGKNTTAATPVVDSKDGITAAELKDPAAAAQENLWKWSLSCRNLGLLQGHGHELVMSSGPWLEANED